MNKWRRRSCGYKVGAQMLGKLVSCLAGVAGLGFEALLVVVRCNGARAVLYSTHATVRINSNLQDLEFTRL